MTKTAYNFCAGPAGLPKPVLMRAQEELLDWQGLGASVMEVSHRSAEYQSVATHAENNLRKLLNISDDYAVLFLQGGASLQFSNIPLSLLTSTNASTKNGVEKTAQYYVNGVWSGKASAEAKRFASIEEINVLNIDNSGQYSLSLPSVDSQNSNHVYLHYAPNETIGGVRFNEIPQTNLPLVADMSSCILSEELNLNRFDLIYAGAQKNIGPAGMCIVIVKRSLIKQMCFDNLPKSFNYQLQDEKGSMLNTPPTYSWYLAGLVFDWVVEQGGVQEMEKRAKQKSSALYQCIDQDDFYHNPVQEKYRSRMNVPFILKDESLNSAFLREAEASHLMGLKGHRSLGGMRASLYNAVSQEAVNCLIDFMQDFKRKYG